jgi:hypothetical protein
MSEQSPIVVSMIDDLTELFLKWTSAGISMSDIAIALTQYGEGMQRALDETMARLDVGPLQ